MLRPSTAPRWKRHTKTGRERAAMGGNGRRSEEHTSELQSQSNLVCRLLLEKKKNKQEPQSHAIIVGNLLTVEQTPSVGNSSAICIAHNIPTPSLTCTKSSSDDAQAVLQLDI